MVRKILEAKDPFLRQVAKPVGAIDKKIKDVVKDLKDTLNVQKDPEGVGLAAPQIGKSLRIFYISHKEASEIFINPEITSRGPIRKSPEKGKIMEGCLSLPNYYGPLERSGSVTVNYRSEEGAQKTKTIKGFLAQIIQHEVDHLNGVLFVDRLLEQKKKLYKLASDDEWEEVDI
ncbi:peptide deformylase [Candidatus Woesebacteria bacterium RBG_19FT_COMBO_42_9]|uniref:Peptide deformylase n=1 Tax=Candidatus Woesebacteria bacterium RBG_16_42_24 TaxID=1802485 RepID=A0A1F7XLW6_9BACT|nr:MAG: peptide deformylase [Candidatus Woesebacteria bacterium RBG_16_42_24]OGM17558.1 MAG: peptide deformylase [Candidatus Woesebacteria bacterium RBG_19FT_COMBO_42_9]OGM67631.1 MAG: peptide deformylase [Candidatus Woesebacteria bacterium RIFCSPLOWO2_01_FULL_43_11]